MWQASFLNMFPDYASIEVDECSLMEPPLSDIALGKPNPWRVPNWRIPQEYEKFKCAPLAGLQWEFIRRSEQYRSLWQRMQEKRGSSLFQVGSLRSSLPAMRYVTALSVFRLR
jgi:hypothetical protein